MSKLDSKIPSAIKRLLKPMIRVLIKNGVSFQEFSDWVKEVFVVSAEEVMKEDGRRPTTASISVMTGLNRKDAAKWREALAGDDLNIISKQANRAMRVLSAWTRLAKQNAWDNVIPLHGDDHSFTELCREYSGDMPTKAVLNELIRLDMVATVDSNVTKLKNEFIPDENIGEVFRIIGVAAVDLLSTIEHNVSATEKQKAPNLQLSVAYDQLAPEVIQEFKKLSEKKAVALIHELDQWLAEHDNSATEEQEQSSRAGMGFYFFNND